MAIHEKGRASGEGAARKIVQLGGSNCSESNQSPLDLQVRQLTRRFMLSMPAAMLVARLAYGEAQQ